MLSIAITWANSNPDNNRRHLPGNRWRLPDGVWAMAAYFNNTVYYGDVNGTLKAFSITNAKLSTSPTSQTTTVFSFPGTTPSVSANMPPNAIVWAVENSDPAVLHAYDATNLAQRAVQQQSGRLARPVRPRQQIHNSRDRKRQSLCRDPDRSRGVWIIAVASDLQRLFFPSRNGIRPLSVFD